MLCNSSNLPFFTLDDGYLFNTYENGDSKNINSSESKPHKRFNHGVLKAGVAIANLIGLDIRRFICDKKVSSSSNGDISPINSNLSHHLPEIHVINDDINDPTIPHDINHYAKHATYHGSTKHSFRPTINQALVGYTNIVTTFDNYSQENNLSIQNNSYNDNTTHYLAAENRRKSSTTSTDSSDILAHSDNTTSLTCILPQSQRRTSSNSSINSSSINPSFDPGDEGYYNIDPRIIPAHNKKLNTTVLQRPATLNLYSPYSRRHSLYCRNQCNCYKSSPSSSTTPSPRQHHVGQSNHEPSQEFSNTPSDAFLPQRIARFKLKDSINPFHTLLDLPAEGQSQDGTIPLTALMSQLEMAQARLCDDASFLDSSGKFSNRRKVSNKSDEINTQ